MNNTTNVRPEDLNYHATAAQYDFEIMAAIPHHGELHQSIRRFLQKLSSPQTVLELGAGTGITTQLVVEQFPSATLTLVDFDEPMLSRAKEKLGEGIRYVLEDYSQSIFPKYSFDLVISVIGTNVWPAGGQEAACAAAA